MKIAMLYHDDHISLAILAWTGHAKTYLELVKLFHPDGVYIFLLLEPFQERLGQDKVILAPIINAQRREPLVEPSVEGVVQQAFPFGEPALAAPPEHGGRADRRGCESEHFDFTSR
jgi:hypothetical protein